MMADGADADGDDGCAKSIDGVDDDDDACHGQGRGAEPSLSVRKPQSDSSPTAPRRFATPPMKVRHAVLDGPRLLP